MNKLKAVILAAGKGTRMNSDLPKVIHKCLGRPMVHYVIQACKDVKCAKDFIGTEGDTLVLCGDTPLITGKTLTELVEKHRKEANGVTVLSAILDDATGYGRIIRDAAGNFEKIVEHKDATEEERACKEVNSGMYIFNSEALSASLDLLSNDNAAGEYYLTDTIALIKKIGLKVSALPLTGDACDEIRGVNTIDQLEEAEQIMCHRED